MTPPKAKAIILVVEYYIPREIEMLRWICTNKSALKSHYFNILYALSLLSLLFPIFPSNRNTLPTIIGSKTITISILKFAKN
jgi:hypothetical protein